MRPGAPSRGRALASVVGSSDAHTGFRHRQRGREQRVANFDFSATSDPVGGSPSGSASWEEFGFHFEGDVSCLAVTGNRAFAPDQVTAGDIVVVDAPPLPTSKDQCKNGGWQTFGVFKNQGDCVSFVATGGKNPPAHP